VGGRGAGARLNTHLKFISAKFITHITLELNYNASIKSYYTEEVQHLSLYSSITINDKVCHGTVVCRLYHKNATK